MSLVLSILAFAVLGVLVAHHLQRGRGSARLRTLALGAVVGAVAGAVLPALLVGLLHLLLALALLAVLILAAVALWRLVATR